MRGWIKFLTTLPKDRDIIMLARELGCGRHAALGLAADWLCWLDDNSAEGETGLTAAEIDGILCWNGACEALEAIGWATRDEGGFIVAVDFGKHNGESAKKRAETADKVSRWRAARNRKKVTGVTAKGLPEKRREEYKENSSSELKENRADDSGQGLVDAAMTPEPDADDARPARETPRPADADEVADYLNTLSMLRLTPGQRLEAARAFFDEMEAVGWVDAKKRNVWKWKPLARRYASMWAENANSPFKGGGAAAWPTRNTGTFNDRDHSEYDDI